MNMVNRILIILTLGLTFVDKSKPQCHLYMRTSSKPYLYWYASSLSHSQLELRPDLKTLWSVEHPSGSLYRTLTFRVQNNSFSAAIGHYLCAHKPSHVHLCKVDPSTVGANIPLFDIRYKTGVKFVMRAMVPGLFHDILYAKESDGKLSFALTSDVTKPGVKWMAEIVKGCEAIFEDIGTTPNIRVTTGLLTSPTIPEIEVDPSPTESLCMEDGEGIPCIPPGSERDITNVLNNAVLSMNETFSDMDADEQENMTYTSTAQAIVLRFAERIEILGLQIATHLRVNQTINVKTSDVEMTASNQVLPFAFRKSKSIHQIIIEGGEEQKTYPVVGVAYNSLHKYIKDDVILKDGNDNIPHRLSSQFISASVQADVRIDNVEIVLSHLPKIDDEETETVCAFWNSTGEHHHWSTAGCYKVESESSINFTTCKCTHLTNFALLTAVRKFEIASVHKKVLDLLSLVCCIISIVFLAIGISLFLILLCGERKHTRYIIHLNLMIALFVSQIVFLTGINAVESKIACKCIAFILHYFLLASFTWMFVEGVYLYFAMIKVYSKGKEYLRSYMGLAWGVPAVIVAISGGISHRWYGTNEYCWLSNEGYTIWAFLGPVVVILSVNMVILLLVIRQISILSKYDKVVQDVKIGLRSSLILLPILGVTWVFGMLSVNSDTIAFQYIFSITNSLQGFMITLFHCFLNTEVRKSLKRKFEVWVYSTSAGKFFTSTGQKVNMRIDLTMSSSLRKLSCFISANDEIVPSSAKRSSTKLSCTQQSPDIVTAAKWNHVTKEYRASILRANSEA